MLFLTNYSPLLHTVNCISVLKILDYCSVTLITFDSLPVCRQQHARPPCPSGDRSLPQFASWSLLRFMFFELVMPSNHLILCRPLLLLPSIFPSNRVFPNESALRIRWPKYWSISFSINGIIPSDEYSGLISFRMD